jgi:hypothetical protein
MSQKTYYKPVSPGSFEAPGPRTWLPRPLREEESVEACVPAILSTVLQQSHTMCK